MSGRIQRRLVREARNVFKAAASIAGNPSRDTRPVFILGVQRSGTTLLLDCLDRSREVSVMGESSKAMVDFRIREDEAIKAFIASSRYKVIVFKPLTDSDRVLQFLDFTPTSLVIWAYRRVEDRANSAVAKFGSHNLEILRDLKAGKGFDRWQARGLTQENLELIKSFDYTDMSPHTAAAIFWWIRNDLFFVNELQGLDTVLPVAYEDLVSFPHRTMPGICRFIGCTFREQMVRDVHAKSVKRDQSRIDGRAQRMCSEMYENLQAVQRQKWEKLKLGSD